MLAEHRNKIDAEFAINEGGKGVFDRDLRYARFEIQTAEKTPRRIDLKAVGHFRPRLDSAQGQPDRGAGAGRWAPLRT